MIQQHLQGTGVISEIHHTLEGPFSTTDGGKAQCLSEKSFCLGNKTKWGEFHRNDGDLTKFRPLVSRIR